MRNVRHANVCCIPKQPEAIRYRSYWLRLQKVEQTKESCVWGGVTPICVWLIT